MPDWLLHLGVVLWLGLLTKIVQVLPRDTVIFACLFIALLTGYFVAIHSFVDILNEVFRQ